jgi:hypothetical protein
LAGSSQSTVAVYCRYKYTVEVTRLSTPVLMLRCIVLQVSAQQKNKKGSTARVKLVHYPLSIILFIIQSTAQYDTYIIAL